MGALSTNKYGFDYNRLPKKEILEENIRFLIYDINNLFRSAKQNELLFDNYVNILDVDKVDKLFKKILRLRKKYAAFLALYSRDANDVKYLNLDDQTDWLNPNHPLFSKLLADPKNLSADYTDKKMVISKGKLSLNYKDAAIGDIQNFEISSPDIEAGIAGTYKNSYIIKTSPEDIFIDVRISLTKRYLLNYISFTPASFNTFYLYSGFYKKVDGTKESIPDIYNNKATNKSLFYFSPVYTNEITIRFKLINYKRTNRMKNYTNKDLAEYFLQHPYDYQTTADTEGYYYIYNFGILDAAVGYKAADTHGIFVSKFIDVGNISRISLESDVVKDKVDVEYYLYLIDKGDSIRETLIPILPYGTTTIEHEVVFPRKVANSYFAYLSFVPDPDSLTVYANGISMSKGRYIVNDKEIKFLNPPHSSAVITATYNPLHATKSYLVDINGETQKYTKTQSFKFYECKISDVDKTLFYELDYLFDPHDVSLKTYINGEEINKGRILSLNGRIINIDLPYIENGYLTGCDFVVSGNLYSDVPPEDSSFYYSQNGEVFYNTEKLPSNYSGTQVSVIVVAHKYSGNNYDGDLAIDQLKLFTGNADVLNGTLINFTGIHK
jgi:hypothetical protein